MDIIGISASNGKDNIESFDETNEKRKVRDQILSDAKQYLSKMDPSLSKEAKSELLKKWVKDTYNVELAELSQDVSDDHSQAMKPKTDDQKVWVNLGLAALAIAGVIVFYKLRK